MGNVVLCDEQTYQKTVSRIAFEHLASVTVKGKKQPIAVFKPVHVHRKPHGVKVSSVMVGREQELKKLRDEVESHIGSKHCCGKCLILEGEAGVGKSAILNSVIQSLSPSSDSTTTT